jgi:phosphatidylinositol alpha-1,6-mannosyltransferase
MARALKFYRGLPYLCYAHGEEMTCASQSRELSWLVRRVFNRAELVLANSRNTERILREYWQLPPERIRLLHPGVATQRFVPAARDAAVRTQLGWGERPVLLTVGRLQRRKGHDHLILALRSIRQTIPNVLYAIVGDGDERASLKGLVAREGLEEQVQFLGELNEQQVIQCYQQCDLFVLPNRQIGQDIEGFGIVLLEAQACGKPVVAGTSGGTAETMRIPETGQVVSCERPEELAALLSELLGDRARLTRMGEAARSWVVEHFDWESSIRRATGFFQEVASRRNPTEKRELVGS